MKFHRRQILGSAVGAGVAVVASGTTVFANQGSAGHIVLIGDSIFDNKRYVGSGPAVIDQVRSELPSGWKATLLAVDGSVTSDVVSQLRRVPSDATHLIVSVGGNDALGQSGILTKPASSSTEVFLGLANIRETFARDYQRMLRSVMAFNKRTAICTVYNPNFEQPSMQRMSVTALSVFNDAIYRSAGKNGLPLIDLRLIFTAKADYANPIEPSSVGGAKIARVIRTVVTGHDFFSGRSVIYS